jgi:CHAT domain-containing protein
VLIPRDFEPGLRRAEEVVIVPDGALLRLPFEALVVQQSPAAVRYWIDDGPVARYAPSATALYNLARRGPRRTGAPSPAALVVANPVFDRNDARDAADLAPGRLRWERSGEKLVRLPGTAREAEAIRQALGQPAGLGATVLLAGLDAEEGRVRAALRERPRYLHFATHGLVDERRNEILAALALTPPSGGPLVGGNDGLLQLFEIYELDLDSDLVVLSACKTQAGRQLAGEGVFALSRGFLAAGARRVVASLWPADDDATALLMSDLYQRLATALAAGREPDYARALRDARLALRHSGEWSAPAFWAPFVFSGIE